MRRILFFIILISMFLPRFLTAQSIEPDEIFVAQGYEDSPSTPIIVKKGSLLRSAVDGYFINNRRYNYYRKLHEFANDESFKGREREILNGFGGFLTESDSILKEMIENTNKLELSSERLKEAQSAVDSLEVQVVKLALQNRALQEKLEQPVKQKKKWAVPVLIGAVIGITIGVLIN